MISKRNKEKHLLEFLSDCSQQKESVILVQLSFSTVLYNLATPWAVAFVHAYKNTIKDLRL